MASRGVTDLTLRLPPVPREGMYEMRYGITAADDNRGIEKVDLDALDACAELINCINGMFASDSAPKFYVDMLPPVYAEGNALLSPSNGKFVVLPVHVMGKEIKIVSAFRGKIIAKGEN